MKQGHGDDTYRYPDIRLNFSSNVYCAFDHSALYRHLSEKMTCITNYPEPSPHSLEVMLAEHLHIRDTEVMVTNGAVEAIYLIAQAFHGCRSHIFEPTFSEYAEACRINKHDIVDGEADLIWLCNPNNPTGEVIPREIMLQAMDSQRYSTLVIDQSYDRFTDMPMLSAAEAVSIGKTLVLHSMTKEYAIPGLRLGYIIGSEPLLSNIRRYQMPWSVNAMAIEAGKYLLNHDEDYTMDIPMLRAECERTASSLREMGITVADSNTHILLCTLPKGTAADLKDYLALNHGILIRDASNFKGLTPRHFRIAVQGEEEDNILINAIRQYVL